MPRYILPKGAYQAPDDSIRALAEGQEAALRRDFGSAFDLLKTAVPLDRLERLLEARKLSDILAEIPLDDLTKDMHDVFIRVGGIYDEAAQTRIDEIDPQGALLRPFDRLDPVVVQQLTTFRADMVREISNTTQDAIRQVLYTSAYAWNAPAEQARDLRNVIGLTTQQAQAVVNFRRMLEQGDPNALDRALRDRRFDGTVDRLIAGEVVPAEKIDTMVERYASRYLDYRATTIARTESLRAANRGARAGVQQAVRRDVVQAGQITRFWSIAQDESTCPFCRSIPELNPDGVGLDEPYQSSDGPIDGPDDSHPNCRCTETYKVSRGDQPDEEGDDE